MSLRKEGQAGPVETTDSIKQKAIRSQRTVHGSQPTEQSTLHKSQTFTGATKESKDGLCAFPKCQIVPRKVGSLRLLQLKAQLKLGEPNSTEEASLPARSDERCLNVSSSPKDCSPVKSLTSSNSSEDSSIEEFEAPRIDYYHLQSNNLSRRPSPSLHHSLRPEMDCSPNSPENNFEMILQGEDSATFQSRENSSSKNQLTRIKSQIIPPPVAHRFKFRPSKSRSPAGRPKVLFQEPKKVSKSVPLFCRSCSCLQTSPPRIPSFVFGPRRKAKKIAVYKLVPIKTPQFDLEEAYSSEQSLGF